MEVDPRTHTKNGKLRKGSRPTITEKRFWLRKVTWDRVQAELRIYLKTQPQGAAIRMARVLGLASSQIHRYSCEKCEHDQEPRFTIGMSILMYIAYERAHPVVGEAEIVYNARHRRRPKAVGHFEHSKELYVVN